MSGIFLFLSDFSFFRMSPVVDDGMGFRREISQESGRLEPPISRKSDTPLSGARYGICSPVFPGCPFPDKIFVSRLAVSAGIISHNR
jgi:hypothetical protein